MDNEPANLSKVQGAATGGRAADRVKKRRKPAPPVDAKDYADAVTSYARLPMDSFLYVGPHFEALARFMQKPYDLRAPVVAARIDDGHGISSFDFATLYDLDPNCHHRQTHHNTIESFAAQADELIGKGEHGQLVFLRGWPSPSWLLAVATKYALDPGILDRHLGLRLATQAFFEQPALPSGSSMTTRLRITTIAYSDLHMEASGGRQRRIDYLRQRESETFEKYTQAFRTGRLNLSVGESLVRNCTVHDTQHFTIEQDITIHIQPCNGSWVVLVWLDHGAGLGTKSTAWVNRTLHPDDHKWQGYLPTVQQKPNIAFSHHSRHEKVQAATTEHIEQIPQSASLVHLDYGRNLKRSLMSRSALYALHELFELAALSENQFLNLVQSKLERELEISAAKANEAPTLVNLMKHLAVIERHVQRLQENIHFINSLRSDEGKEQTVTAEETAAAERLALDYNALADRAIKMQEQCHRNLQFVMNITTVIEAQKSIQQAKEITNLSRLAFFFIPLTYVTSFFGMNLRELGQGVAPIWAWVAISVPLPFISAFFLHPSARQWVRARFISSVSGMGSQL